jgi:hypothetical protein
VGKKELNPDLARVVGNFQFKGNFIEALPHGSGHIHDTYAVWFRTRSGKPHPYLLQRINQHVFKDPQNLVQNIERITRHLQRKITTNGGDPLRETLTLIPTKSGLSIYEDGLGGFWRAYVFIENAFTVDKANSTLQVYQAAKSYGKFQTLLADFPARDLVETIPDFHHTPRRFQNLMEAVGRDACGRVSSAEMEIQFARERRQDTRLLVDLIDQGELPIRITHNDTKLNNVMFDDASGEAVCVIDLDTVMPGTVLYDFGDAVRSAAALSAEDEHGTSGPAFSLDIFEYLTRGYLESAGGFLTPAELDNLVFSAKLMSLECGMRFLTDYLNGDTYFKVNRSGQNLDRCRTQFRLVKDIEAHMDDMQHIVDKNLKNFP